MEKWQKEHIDRNLPNLLTATECTPRLLALLISANSLSEAEKNQIDTMLQHQEKVTFLYTSTQNVSHGFLSLLKALNKTGQTGAVDLLLQGIPEKSCGNILGVVGNQGYIIPDIGENVALSSAGATMMKSGVSHAALDGNFTNYDASSGYSEHKIIGESEMSKGIVIQFKHTYLINRLRLLLWDKHPTHAYSYYVEVSQDMEKWTMVWDHRRYLCRSWQYIVFPEARVRYIRIVGTYSTNSNGFHLVYVKANLSRHHCSFDETSDTSLGVLVPSSNMATLARGAQVTQGVLPQFLLNGQASGYNGSTGFTHHVISFDPIHVQLPQPVRVSSMRLLLWDGDQRTYDYMVFVSTDKNTWTLVCNRKGERSWQNLEFPPIRVLYIKLMGTANSKKGNNGFHCVHLECPSAIKINNAK